MKFKFEIDLDNPAFKGAFKGETFLTLQRLLSGVQAQLGTVEYRFDPVMVPRVELPLPQDEFGASSWPINDGNTGAEIGRFSFYVDEPVQTREPPPFKAPAAKR